METDLQDNERTVGLDELLAGLGSRTAMSASQLDGFLAGIALAPA